MGFEASGVCPRGPGWVVEPIWKAGRGWKPTCRLGGVGRTTQMSGKPTQRYGRGRESHPKVREGSGGPPVGGAVVGRHTQRSGLGR